MFPIQGLRVWDFKHCIDIPEPFEAGFTGLGSSGFFSDQQLFANGDLHHFRKAQREKFTLVVSSLFLFFIPTGDQ